MVKLGNKVSTEDNTICCDFNNFSYGKSYQQRERQFTGLRGRYSLLNSLGETQWPLSIPTYSFSLRYFFSLSLFLLPLFFLALFFLFLGDPAPTSALLSPGLSSFSCSTSPFPSTCISLPLS